MLNICVTYIKLERSASYCVVIPSFYISAAPFFALFKRKDRERWKVEWGGLGRMALGNFAVNAADVSNTR